MKKFAQKRKKTTKNVDSITDLCYSADISIEARPRSVPLAKKPTVVGQGKGKGAVAEAKTFSTGIFLLGRSGRRCGLSQEFVERYRCRYQDKDLYFDAVTIAFYRDCVFYLPEKQMEKIFEQKKEKTFL